MRKKIFTFLLAFATSVGLMNAAVDDSGSCGANVTYSFNGTTGEMVISGTGPMTVFSSGTAPWKNYKADITSVVVEDGVTSVSQYSFGQCTNLTTVVIGNDVETIGQFAFNDCGASFTSLTLGSSLKSVGMAAFLNAHGITTLTLPDGFETVGDYAFCRLEALQTLNIPSSVTSIGTSAFYRCYPLATINCAAVTPPSLGDDAFGDIANKSNIPLNVPNGSVAAYTAAAQWNAFNIHGYDPAPGGGSTPDPVDPTPAGPIPCTAADLGKVLCTDGSIYATVSEATAASKTAAAVITYVDTENGKALAFALADESNTMVWETAKTTAAAHTPAVSGGTWTLPSKDDWNNMINAAGGYAALLNGFSAVGGTNIQEAWYWTSTEYDWDAFACRFDNGVYIMPYPGPCYVRACLAFDIPAAPASTDEQVITNQDPENPSYHYSTFFHSTQNYKLTNDGTQAFIATLSNNDLVLTKIAEGTQVIPANTAVIFRKSGSADPVVLTPTEENGVSFSANNDLLGVDAETAAPANCYVLSGTNQYGVGFYRINSENLKAHKAYVIYTGSAAPKRMRFVFNQEQVVTGIDNANADTKAEKRIENGQLIIIKNGVRYNAQGQLIK